MSPNDETRTLPRSWGGYPVRQLRVEVVGGTTPSSVAEAGLDRIRVGSAQGNDLVLVDPTVSRYHLDVVRQADRIVVVDHRSTNGTRIGSVLVRGGEVIVDPGTIVSVGEARLRIDEGPPVMLELGSPSGTYGVRGKSPAIRRVTASIEKLALKDVPVLVIGESGTGKELVARALHDAGPRRDGPFVTLDCGAISQHLFVAEIMGHERGAFTGAEASRPGVFERANGGTLFIDEIGELPLEHQAALLGVLERRRVRRVGGRDEVGFDVRVVAATHRDLKAAVNAGTFRLDLFFRLAVVTLHVPPLRERIEDVVVLAEHFLREEGDPRAVETCFGADALAALMRHDWPGNVRELRNVVLATLATGETPTIAGTAPPPPPRIDEAGFEGRYRDARRRVVDAFERGFVTRLLERTAGNVREAARVAEMDRKYLMELLSRHGLR